MAQSLCAILLVFAIAILLRCPLAISMMAVGSVFLIYSLGFSSAVSIIGSSAYHVVGNWLYTVIPMFIVMGEFIGRSGIISDCFYLFKRLVGGLRGALCVATIITSVLLSFATGSSLAATALLARIAYPEMTKARYTKAESLSALLAGGSLANMIPPSIGLPLYAILTNQSIAKMLMAGVVPGLLACALYILYILLTSKGVAVTHSDDPKNVPGVASFATMIRFISFFLLVSVMVTGIHFGFFSAIEASSIGACGAFLIALVFGRLRWVALNECLKNSIILIGVIFFLLFGIGLFSRYLAFTGFSRTLASLVVQKEVSPTVFIMLVGIAYLGLGCLIDPTSMLLLVVPILYPTVQALGIDPIWFGVYTIAWVQIGQLTPPVGMSVYVLHSVTREPLEECFRTAIPVIIVWVTVVAAMVAYPNLVLWLPSTVRG
ncbi:MAG: TRAP transporter large permease [Candidatus Bathyarchaeia archaeon]